MISIYIYIYRYFELYIWSVYTYIYRYFELHIWWIYDAKRVTHLKRFASYIWRKRYVMLHYIYDEFKVQNDSHLTFSAGKNAWQIHIHLKQTLCTFLQCKCACLANCRFQYDTLDVHSGTSPVTQLHGCPNCVSHSSLCFSPVTLCTKELWIDKLRQSGIRFSIWHSRRALWHSVMSHKFVRVVTYHSRRSSGLPNCNYRESLCNIWEFWNPLTWHTLHQTL